MAPRGERVAVAPHVGLRVERRPGNPMRPAFVLLHGLASNLRLWDGVAEALHARDHTVVAVDQRGHGRSDAPEEGYDLVTAVTDVLAVTRELGLERPVLAGQSWGGNVVLELAWRHPEATRGIACVDGGLIELQESFPSWEACLAALSPPRLDGLRRDDLRARVHAAHPDFPPRAVEAVLANFRERPDGTLEPRLRRDRHLRILRSLWEHRPSTRLPGLVTPTLLLLVDGGNPESTAAKRQAEARALARAARVRSHWFSPAHHDVHAEQPERVAEVLLGAVDEGFFP